jgi:hypothetical protein
MAYEIEGATGLQPVKMLPNGTGFTQSVNVDALIVTFYQHSEVDIRATTECGYTVYRDVDFVEISHPGENLNIVRRPVRMSDVHRWPDKWKAYKENREQAVSGTPIELLFPTHPSQGKNLRMHNVHTIEQCANLTATGISALGPYGQNFVNAAQTYLEQQRSGVPTHKYEMERAESHKQMEQQQVQIQNLIEQLNWAKKTIEGLQTQVHQGWGPQGVVGAQGMPHQAPQQPANPFVLKPPGADAPLTKLDTEPRPTGASPRRRVKMD